MNLQEDFLSGVSPHTLIPHPHFLQREIWVISACFFEDLLPLRQHIVVVDPCSVLFIQILAPSYLPKMNELQSSLFNQQQYILRLMVKRK